MEETTDMKALGPMEIDKSRNDPNKKERGAALTHQGTVRSD